MRGRVGRSGHRAYAYLFTPIDKSLSEEAFERLRTIGETTELGSGFRLAMKDLEIRGAGNLLGTGQSGHVASVGYLEVGHIRLKEGGGLAGHNGLRSVKQHLKNQDFCRIRVGIGKPFPNQKGAQYVLSKPGKKESEELLLSVVTAADSIESILKIGFESSMQIFNKKI